MFDGAAQPSTITSRTAFDVGDIFRDHGEEYRESHRLSRAQSLALGAVAACRTAKLGGHLQSCVDCDYASPAYNSCRNRHCPKCQSLQQAAWIEKRQERVLPTHYFHVVLTLPEALRGVVYANPFLLGVMLRTAAQTLLLLGEDPKRLGAQLGVTTVLHTWTRALQYHPHVHCIVTGGGLTSDAARWVPARSKYLFPARVISRLFRGRFMYNLVCAYDAGKLQLERALGPHPEAFRQLKKALYAQDWVAYAKRPFGGPEQIISYLGRYTHRVGIANQRLRSVTPTEVVFATKDGKTTTMAPQEFIRRFLLHVLPRGFVKIRHYGLSAGRHVMTRLASARQILLPEKVQLQAEEVAIIATPDSPLDMDTEDTWIAQLLKLSGINVRLCPCCNGPLIRWPLALLNSS